MSQNKYDAFISYKAEDTESARWLRAALESRGVLCWLAPGSIPNSSTYAKEVVNAIKNSSVFILLLSEKTQESHWISRELEIALNYQKTIITYKIEEFEIDEAFSLKLNSKHIYENFDNNPEILSETISEIKNVIKSTEEPCENKSALSPFHTFIKKVSPYSDIQTNNKIPSRIFTVFLLLLFFLECKCLLVSTTNIISIFIISVIVILVFGKATKKLVIIYSGINNKFLSAVISVVSVILLLSISSFALMTINHLIFRIIF